MRDWATEREREREREREIERLREERMESCKCGVMDPNPDLLEAVHRAIDQGGDKGCLSPTETEGILRAASGRPTL
jgi:rRNA maturation endonuclease Nob1